MVDGQLPAWVIPGASVMVALIGALALVIVRKIRGPVAIQDLWDENRKLRADVDKLGEKVDGLIESRETQLNVNRVMGEGFDALSHGIERLEVKPSFTRTEHAAIERARAVRSDETIWLTVPRKT